MACKHLMVLFTGLAYASWFIISDGIGRTGEESPVCVELFHNGMNFVCMCTRCCNTSHCFHSLLLSFVVYCLHYHSSVFPFLDEKPALSVTERGFLTGDKSVFDLISPQDRARLKRVKEGKAFPIDSESLPNTASQHTEPVVPSLNVLSFIQLISLMEVSIHNKKIMITKTLNSALSVVDQFHQVKHCHYGLSLFTHTLYMYKTYYS